MVDSTADLGYTVFEAIGVGMTTAIYRLYFDPNREYFVRQVSFDVYVGIKPSLTAYPTKGTCHWCYGSDFLSENDATIY